jgi:hypothetical protein
MCGYLGSHSKRQAYIIVQASTPPISFLDAGIFIFQEKESRTIQCWKMFKRLVTEISNQDNHPELFRMVERSIEPQRI